MISLENVSKMILVESRLGTTPLMRTAEKVCKILNDNGVDCALIGGLALHIYGYSRYTGDADFIVAKKEEARDILLRNGFKQVQGSSMSLIDNETGTQIDLVEQGKQDSPQAIPYPDPKESVNARNLKVISINNLIEMKLSSYKLGGTIRGKDGSDVANLIIVNKLPRDFMIKSRYQHLKDDYERIWDELQKK